ncbi:hypothetical protein [Mesorhizobium sp. KR9-304]|uniref:hypothetical protein n=1 Tax=Mesorhizobium sp. KR9-304 TaxID=3156614 RepID=UPI0032B519C5
MTRTQTFVLALFAICLPNFSYAVDDQQASRLLLDKIACKAPFSVAATFLDMRAAGFIGPKFADYDSASCFHLAKPLDLLASQDAPIEYICFSDRHLFTALPDLFTRGPGTQSDFISIGFTDRSEAIESIWQDDGTKPAGGFFDERNPKEFFPAAVAPVSADAEWTCFPPASVSSDSFWRRYGNARFGYWIDIPPGFSAITEAENGDGGTSKSEDGKVDLSVWGSHITEGDFAAEIWNRIELSNANGWKITYQKKTDEWASWSGTKGNRIMYQRAIALCDSQAAFFLLEYDHAEVAALDPMVERLVESFKSGEDCN